MKKIYILLLFMLISFSFFTANSFYTNDSNLEKQFIKSPSLNEIKLIEIKLIENKIQKVCEIIFLKAYMRRSFTNNENKYCSDIFERKIEAEMNYKKRVLGERGIFY